MAYTTLFKNCTALLMDDDGTVLENAYVTVEGDHIQAVGTKRPDGVFAEEIDCGGNVLMPGFVNAHTHLPMTLLRGYGGGCDLQTWLTQYIFPAEDKLDGRAVRAGTALALAELIAAGVTTVADMYMFCDEITEEVVQSGISANIARGSTLFSPTLDEKTFPACVETRRLAEVWHGYGNGQILVDVSIHGEYTSNPALWTTMADYAKEKNLGMHVHVSETQTEHAGCLERCGTTPIQILNRYGVWDTRAIAAHCVFTTEEDWALMAAKGISCVHNPVSNLKLGSGVAPVPQMKKAGVNVCLGTDGVSSNNNHSMFEEMKLAALLPSGLSHNPMALSPRAALRMATSDGAKALGRKTGQIAPGFTADLILVDFDRPHLTPCHSVEDNLVYSATASDVIMNMARGRIIYQNGVYHTLDLARIQAEVKQYALPLLFG